VSINDCAIKVQNLSKTFKVYTNPKEMLKELVLGGKRHSEFHALCDVSFTVPHGEVVGVMGRNGAGKSTLLRILTGTLDKTSGTVEVAGKVSAILELGTGFNPEYTGRENILSGGLVLGMGKAELALKLDEIISFAELEEFIDQPFRTYSSGMQARLTFATAVSVSPDILIIDEALSVGDAAFQRKCYAKMQEFRENGKTIFLVTHSDNALVDFCDRGILLHKGEMIADGSPLEVQAAYFKILYGLNDMPALVSEDSQENSLCLSFVGKKRVGDGQLATITYAKLLDEVGNTPEILKFGKRYTVEFGGVCRDTVEALGFGVTFRTITGVVVYAINSQSVPTCQKRVESDRNFCCHFSFTSRLINNYYFITIDIGDYAKGKPLDQIADALSIKTTVNKIIHSVSLVDFEADMVLDVG
jgi:ABC-type polysaccharide/polyol phosphate transport system ATPase subunit